MDHDSPADQSLLVLDDTWRTARSFGGGMDLWSGSGTLPSRPLRSDFIHHPTSQLLAGKFLAIAGYFRPRTGLVFRQTLFFLFRPAGHQPLLLYQYSDLPIRPRV